MKNLFEKIPKRTLATVTVATITCVGYLAGTAYSEVRDRVATLESRDFNISAEINNTRRELKNDIVAVRQELRDDLIRLNEKMDKMLELITASR